MASQRMFKSSLKLLLRKNYSTTNNLVNLTKNEATGTSIVSMNRPPLNALTRGMLAEFRETLHKVEENDSTGVIITSSVLNIFSAGLELTELHTSDMIHLLGFWNEIQETWLKLYSLSIPVAAAINGSCSSAGCAFALACDYRVFVEGKYEMGFNETQLGAKMPLWYMNILIDTIGHRRSELALHKGELFAPKEALEIGLVDELATNKEDATVKCQKYLDDMSKIPTAARAAIKRDIRNERIDSLGKNRDADFYRFTGFNVISNSEAAMKSYFETLMKKN